MLQALFLLANVGLVVWIWRISKGKEAHYDSSGFVMASAPRASLPAVGYTAASRPTRVMEGPERNLIKDPDLKLGGRRPETGLRRATSARAEEDRSIAVRPETRRRVEKAARVYFRLKKSPQFKNSPTIRAWKKDFLSFADLRSIDEQFNRDHDAVRFLVGVGRSPNFPLLLQKHLAAADIQTFMREIRMRPELVGASQELLKEFNLGTAANLFAAVSPAPETGR